MSRTNSRSSSASFGMLKIAGGIGVFIVAWIVQATMGDSSMFSMTYTDRGFWPGLLVNVTFFPGWIATVALIGGGIMEVADSSGGEPEPKPWERG